MTFRNKSGSRCRSSLVLVKALQDGVMARLLQETQQVIWAEPHGGSVGHGVEVDTIMVPLHQVLVQDQPHTVVLIEEQRERCGTSLPHLRGQGRAFRTSKLEKQQM